MQITKDQEATVRWLTSRPVELGHLLGFTKLTELHNGWMVEMIKGRDDETLQAHRGSYKTTCVSIVLFVLILVFPNDKTLFMRKTGTDVQEVVRQVKKIIQSDIGRAVCRKLWGVDLELTIDRVDQLNTNLAVNDPRGTPQLTAIGSGGSMTGKHYDRIFTDDIVNIEDRTSKAERDRIKLVYQEIQNLKNRGGRIFNTGTPWHKDDAFSIMPEPKRFDCYATGLISAEELQQIRKSMINSLFAANYELRHVAAEDVIFEYPSEIGADPALVEQGICHIDAAYGGSDYTAFTIIKKSGGKYYVLGKCWQKHVSDCIPEIIRIRKSANAGKIWCEDNGDKGYLAKDLKGKKERAVTYHESMNKFIKITTHLKRAWPDIIFVDGTDKEYIEMITDYNEDAEHDDCPDSLASLIRIIYGKKETLPKNSIYA